MDATIVYENLLLQIQKSCLNYKLEMSPFSATISLKKSFIRNKSGTPVYPQSLESLPRAENVQKDTFNIEMMELKNKLHQLEYTTASYKMKYEEEVLESETLQQKLKETLNKLDNLHNLFDINDASYENLKNSKNQLEKKHEKTCSELCNVKDEVENVKKDLVQSRITIKTLRKEAKEADSKHLKVVKKNEDTIDTLQRYKVQKQSEERDFKLKERKLNRKIRSVDERETKCNLTKKDFIKTELSEANLSSNNNHIVQVSLPSLNYRESITMASYNYVTNITTFPSVVSHWLPLLPIPANLPPIPRKVESSRLSESRSPWSLRRVWKCDQCDQTFPGGSTLDQAMHMYEHKKEMKQ